MLSISKILCPLDYSDPSLEALKLAGEWATHFGAGITVLHVAPDVQAVMYEAPLAVINLMAADEERRAEELNRLQQTVSGVVPASVSVECQVRLGDPATVIVETARQLPADLLILATHGHTGWRHFIFGSVAEAVVRAAPCPVLTHHLAADKAADAGKLDVTALV